MPTTGEAVPARAVMALKAYCTVWDGSEVRCPRVSRPPVTDFPARAGTGSTSASRAARSSAAVAVGFAAL
ncbi:hypothetical protein DQ241_02295 [Blastococcus sp. TF02A-30]|nr:hypothetical protein DQ241_02295 [Blastococcus sp. TF02A-30]